MKLKLKKGDMVRIIAGKHKGKEGLITNIGRDEKNPRIFVEGITSTKHRKPTQDQEGGVEEIPASVHISNVALIDPKNKKTTTRIGIEKDKNGKNVRVAKKSGKTL